jgi:hypothetical protein
MIGESPGRVTDADRAAYVRDGVVCLRGVLSRETARDLLALWDEVAEDLEGHGLVHTAKERKRAMPGAFAVKHPSRIVPAFKPFMTESPIAGLVGELLGADSVGFYWDQVFVKEPGSTGRTPWHNDAAGHPLHGEQIVGVWIALTEASPANGLECIAGSYRNRELYWPATAYGDLNPIPEGRRRCPDFEARRGDPDVTFLGWDMAPGDALFIHPRTLHFSRGNTTAARRVAYATWWHGDDVTWAHRPECETGPPGVDFAAMPRGARPDAPHFPILWRRGA